MWTFHKCINPFHSVTPQLSWSGLLSWSHLSWCCCWMESSMEAVTYWRESELKLCRTFWSSDGGQSLAFIQCISLNTQNWQLSNSLFNIQFISLWLETDTWINEPLPFYILKILAMLSNTLAAVYIYFFHPRYLHNDIFRYMTREITHDISHCYFTLYCASSGFG